MPQNRPFVPLSYGGNAPVSESRAGSLFCGTDAECDDDFAFPESGCLGVFSPSLSGGAKGNLPLLYCLCLASQN